jgi:hypothetical protein
MIKVIIKPSRPTYLKITPKSLTRQAPIKGGIAAINLKNTWTFLLSSKLGLFAQKAACMLLPSVIPFRGNALKTSIAGNRTITKVISLAKSGIYKRINHNKHLPDETRQHNSYLPTKWYISSIISEIQ